MRIIPAISKINLLYQLILASEQSRTRVASCSTSRLHRALPLSVQTSVYRSLGPRQADMFAAGPQLGVHSPPVHWSGGCAKHGLQHAYHTSKRNTKYFVRAPLETLPNLVKAVAATRMASEAAKLQTGPTALEVGQLVELDCTALAFGGQVGSRGRHQFRC